MVMMMMMMILDIACFLFVPDTHLTSLLSSSQLLHYILFFITIISLGKYVAADPGVIKRFIT
jgi:hypothetical protein